MLESVETQASDDELDIRFEDDDENSIDYIWTRPILVGYAFGPKKMSTMGVVMAEASKTHLSSSVLYECAFEREECLSTEEDLEEYSELEELNDVVLAGGSSNTNNTNNSDVNNSSSSVQKVGSKKVIVKNDSRGRKGNVIINLDSYSGGMKNTQMVRYNLHSSSSVDTASTNNTVPTFGTTTAPPSASSSSYRRQLPSSRPCRVSFVPLDPNLPLEGQHGANMDIVLHKLTEDLLNLSTYCTRFPALRNLKDFSPQERQLLPLDVQAAVQRISRLMQYQQQHPECSLADDPAKVLTLMSRSDIAHVLAECLVGVTTGGATTTSSATIPVSSPKFIVWDNNHQKKVPTQTIAAEIAKTNMTYPLIAKPLAAAGTKKSHHMVILLQPSALDSIKEESWLLQEYANHDAVLFKVYVLGDHVRVFHRSSLPNLPPIDPTMSSRTHVNFDSQCPYPRLADFGLPEEKQQKKELQLPEVVTVSEVQPIVKALKTAFGLELFGFDVLITSQPSKQMLVVDVNYFPSYKEVSDFPSLLAQHLSQKAVEKRRRHPTRL